MLPSWEQLVNRRYEPWRTAHVVDTAGRTLEDVLRQLGAIVRRARSSRDLPPLTAYVQRPGRLQCAYRCIHLFGR